MQAVLDFINNHVRDIFIPLTALALLRVGMCLAQLKRMTHLREKKAPTTPSGATMRSWASGSARWRACCCLSLYRVCGMWAWRWP